MMAITLARHLDIKVPVNMLYICAMLDWIVEWSPLIPGDCDAVTMRYRGRYGIYLSRRFTAPCRLRWTLAHEAGHIILGHFFQYNLSILDSEELGRKTVWILNREANLFAETLLMPEDFLRANFSRGQDYLRRACGVSQDALRFRLERLGLVGSMESRQKLLNNIGR